LHINSVFQLNIQKSLPSFRTYSFIGCCSSCLKNLESLAAFDLSISSNRGCFRSPHLVLIDKESIPDWYYQGNKFFFSVFDGKRFNIIFLSP
jgi:hypothetical protein